MPSVTIRTLCFLLLLTLGFIPYLFSQTEDVFASKFLEILNQKRVEEKLPPLQLHDKLTVLAKEWSTKLAQEQRLFHRSSSSLMDFIKQESFSTLNENLHFSPEGNDPHFVLKRWMASPVHHKNLMNPKIKIMGIAPTQGKDGNWYVVWNGGAAQSF